jgi:hypothetical protein
LLSNDEVYIFIYISITCGSLLKTPALLRIGTFCSHLRTQSWTQSALWCITKQSATTGCLSDRWMWKMKDPHIQNADRLTSISFLVCSCSWRDFRIIYYLFSIFVQLCLTGVAVILIIIVAYVCALIFLQWNKKKLIDWLIDW